MNKSLWEHEEELLTEDERKVEKPPLYKVLLHNDDFTSMEFVVFILQSIFHHSESAATRIMLSIHNQGIGVAGVYTREIAETKADKAVRLARENEFPLLCTIEKDA